MKYSKSDLIWIIPGIIGGMGIMASALQYFLILIIQFTQKDFGIFLFHIILVFLVAEKGTIFLASMLKKYENIKK